MFPIDECVVFVDGWPVEWVDPKASSTNIHHFCPPVSHLLLSQCLYTLILLSLVFIITTISNTLSSTSIAFLSHSTTALLIAFLVFPLFLKHLLNCIVSQLLVIHLTLPVPVLILTLFLCFFF